MSAVSDTQPKDLSFNRVTASDADIVLLDPRQRMILRAAELHEADYSPWEGRDLAAWPSMTILRGKIVVENSTFAGDLRDGQFLLRKGAGRNQNPTGSVINNIRQEDIQSAASSWYFAQSIRGSGDDTLAKPKFPRDCSGQRGHHVSDSYG